MNICIYGASSAELEQIYYEKTEELGKMTGKAGAWPCVWRRSDRNDGSSSQRR